MIEVIIEGKKLKPIFNNIGKKIKKVKDGTIINNVLFVNSETCFMSFVSKYNHINVKTVINGIETIKPANKDDFFAISDAATIIIAVIKIFIKVKNIINKLYSF